MLSLHGTYGRMDHGEAVAQMTDYLVPVLLLTACLLALRKKENAYDLMLGGAAEGLKLLLTLIPTLVLLLTAVTMLRSSGAMDMISGFLSPVFSFSVFLRSFPYWY